jgi:threonine/homoserine/homoserine lactone efflux protein
VGSLQLGPVNLYVINSTLFRDKYAAYCVAVGGCIPEFIYCSLAVYANDYLSQFKTFELVLRIGLILILLVLAAWYLMKKNTKVEVTINSNNLRSGGKAFIKGFSLALLNPQLLPFWIIIQVYFNTIALLKLIGTLQRISFILGAGIGAFCLLSILIQLVDKHKEKILSKINFNYFNKALGILFLIIAMQQLYAFLR